MGDLMQCIGACFLWKGDHDRAEDVLYRALLENCGENNENRGGALYTLGNVYLRQRKYNDALRLHQKVLEMYTKDLGKMHH
jgi:tetratricopeptide (TPR) repeat protein